MSNSTAVQELYFWKRDYLVVIDGVSNHWAELEIFKLIRWISKVVGFDEVFRVTLRLCQSWKVGESLIKISLVVENYCCRYSPSDRQRDESAPR